MTVITRFAPSPTGFLHIGGARTALFNWLYAKAKNGKFLLRIEDTDRERSTQEAVDAIIDGLSWLNIKPDEDTTFQFSRADRHREVAEQMVQCGAAFRCYVTPQELAVRREAGEKKRQEAKDAASNGDEALALKLKEEANQLLAPFRSPYRDGALPQTENASYVVRLRAPDSGRVTFNDGVQGIVGVDASAIDDLVLLRSDGTPTYMLAVVVDDHDMGVTDIIRGDDHLANTYRQLPIFAAMGWDLPNYSHVPLIHGQDGKKLSKRHGALGVDAYRDMGFLPEGVANYLLRLGWSHGDDEIIEQAQAIEWFDIGGLGKAPARLDIEKLKHINAHYMAIADDESLLNLLFNRLTAESISKTAQNRVRAGISYLKTRASTLEDLESQVKFLLDIRPIEITGKLKKKFDAESLQRLEHLHQKFLSLSDWNNSSLSDELSSYCSEENIGMGKIGPTLRGALTGSAPSPDLGLVLEWLGREEALKRIEDQINAVD